MDLVNGLLTNVALSIAACLVAYLIAPRARARGRELLSQYPRAGTWLTRARADSQMIDRAFLVVAIGALIGLPIQAIHNYQAFNSYREFLDFDSSVLSLLRGGPITSIVNFDRRFNPILAALVPLYAIWSDPQTLLLLQSLGLAIAAFPLYWFARPRIGRLLAFTVAVAYLASIPVRILNQASFYEIKLAVPLLAFATFFLLRERYVPFLACLAVSLLVKQEVAFIAVGFAAFIFFVQRKRMLGLGLAAFGIALALFVIQFLYPLLTQGRVHPQFDERYAYLGHSLGDVVLALFLRPGLVLEHVLVPSKIELVIYLLAPIAFLPLVGIEVAAISLPVWAYTLLSDLPVQTDPSAYYQAPFLPFLFLGAIVGLRRLLGSKETDRRKIALVTLLAVSAQLYLPSTWARIFDPSALTLDQHAVIGHQVMRWIPDSAKVIAQMEVYVPLVAERKYHVVEFSPECSCRDADFLFGDATRIYYNLYRTSWAYWRAAGYFEPVIEQDGYFLWKRRTRLDPTRQVDSGGAVLGYADAPNPFLQQMGLQYADGLTLLGYALMPGSAVRSGESLRLVVEWQAREDILDRHVILARLEDEQGHVWAQDDHEPVNGFAPTDHWKRGDIIRDQYVLPLPRTMPPGSFKLVVGVWNPDAHSSLDASDADGKPLGIRPVISAVQVKRNTESLLASFLTIDQPFYVDMGEIRLLGSTLLPRQMAPGEELQVGLYWRARAKPRGDYLVTTQLRDAVGRVWAEHTGRPAAGAYPTTRWQAGEVLLDWHDLVVPMGFSSEEYKVAVILRDATNQEELGRAEIEPIRSKPAGDHRIFLPLMLN